VILGAFALEFAKKLINQRHEVLIIPAKNSQNCYHPTGNQALGIEKYILLNRTSLCRALS